MKITTGPNYAHLELKFSPCVELITVVRTFVKDFYEHVVKDPELTWRLALATHELLENAVKFSTDNTTSLQVEVTRSATDIKVNIATRNRASPDQVTRLHEMFDEMKQVPDAFQYYQQLIRRTSKQTTGSGLGLGRVRAEALLNLGYSIDGDLVELKASALEPLREARA